MNKVLSDAIMLLLLGSTIFFVSFSSKVKKDFLWFNISDQNTYLINAALNFNEGYPAGISTTHPGIGSSFTYGFGFRLLKFIGYSDIDKGSDLITSNDPISQLPEVYKLGGDISILIVILCAFLMSILIYILFEQSLLFSTYTFIATLFSGGFLFHSTMLRNELTTTYYFLIASVFFCFAIFRDKYTRNINHTPLLIIAGFFFAISYFTKSQILLSILPMILFAFLLHFKKPIVYSPNRTTSLILLGLTIFLTTYFFFTTSIRLAVFWLITFSFFLLTSSIGVFTNKINSKIIEYCGILSSMSVGFLIGMVFIFQRGLHGDSALINSTLRYTNMLRSDGAKYINLEYGGIFERFTYFLQQYFLETVLLFGLFFLVFFFKQKKQIWPYLVAIILIVGLCFIHSLRVMLAINIGRAVYKYMIFIDVFVVLLIVSFYRNCLRIVQSIVLRKALHGLFWLILILTALKNYHKVEKDVLWNFTTYAWGVYKEGKGNSEEKTIEKILQNNYKGYKNGHDRVFIGDEIRRGQQEMPIPQWQFDRTHKKSLQRFMIKLEEIKTLSPAVKKAIKDLEEEVFKTKVQLFKQGFSYQNIVSRITFKRKLAYKNIFSNKDHYQSFLELLDNGDLTVPF